MNCPSLSINQLVVKAGKKTLLEVDSLEAEPGSFIALLGANGAGKSTLFKSVSGENKCFGQMKLHGRIMNSLDPRQRARHLAVLPQSSQLSFPFSVFEVVALGLIPLSCSREEGERLVMDGMRQTNVDHLSARSYTLLSGGERQRVHLARVLVQLSQAEHPPVLLLDEPTSAQDLGQQHQILALAQSLCHEKGWTVIAILHDLNQAIRYCDQVWLLQSGEVIAQGAPKAVLVPEQVNKVWGYLPEQVISSTTDSFLI